MGFDGAVTGLILAGGSGVRVGRRNKALLYLGTQTLLSRVRERLACQTETILISVHDDPSSWSSLGEGCRIVTDERTTRQGPLAGLEAALRIAPNDWILSVPVDVPFFPLDLATRMGNKLGGERRPVIARNRGQLHPTIALWPREIVAAMRLALDNKDRGLQFFLRKTSHAIADFPDEYDGIDPFFNINTMDDLTWAHQNLRVQT
ncbi:MAG: molybdenum cofactor guanylyltransferase [Magnetococcales bacterium]|nr:molybdenum cofactor guanylyltransferase [Magnetococcales bacterium]